MWREIAITPPEVSSISEKPRGHFGSAFKAKIVRRHLAGKESVSGLAAELGIQPSLIHLWSSKPCS
ncbi:MAG: hypothetical protein EHM42_07125 [Planctomycetaceae bacterium]|nr:MAG: hypothetical protein EHM42_07125 [Planctomycetaceae bacterium]